MPRRDTLPPGGQTDPIGPNQPTSSVATASPQAETFGGVSDEVASSASQAMPYYTRRKMLIGGLALTAITFCGVALWYENSQRANRRKTGQTHRVGVWLPTGSMAIKRIYHSATLLQDGSVLVAAGRSAASSLVDFSEIYAPASGTWSHTKGNPRVPRYTRNNSLVTLANGQALLAGGADAEQKVDYDSCELYDPTSGVWSETGRLNTPRRGACLVALRGEQQVLIAAGAHGPPDASRFLSTAEIYDMTTQKWTFTGSLRVARDGATSVLLHDGRVLIAGGEIPWKVFADTAELYDPTTRTWALTPTMPWGWEGAAMVALP